jgi:hypothetical protein
MQGIVNGWVIKIEGIAGRMGKKNGQAGEERVRFCSRIAIILEFSTLHPHLTKR